MKSGMNSITAHQTVHGYSDGHRLLASSRSFGKIADRQLRFLSDLSGSSNYPLFDEYYTAYSIAEDNLFAIGKTWIATEMERPGCAWTHTLIFKPSELRKLRNTKALENTFVRPAHDNLDDFRSITSIVLELKNGNSYSEQSTSLANRIIEKFYLSSAPVFIVTENPHSCTQVVLDVWLQYLQLSSNLLSFCTASIRSRKIDSIPLDLQVIPPDAVRKIDNSVDDAQMLYTTDVKISNHASEWTDCLVQGLTSPSPPRVYQFISDYATSSCRTEIGHLSQLHEELSHAENNQEDVLGIVQFMASKWSEITSGTSVKTDTLSSPNNRKFLIQIDDLLLIDAITESELLPAFNIVELQLTSRLSDEWRKAPQQVVQILQKLLRSNKESARTIVVDVLANAILTEDIQELLEFPHEIVLSVLNRRLRLLVSPTIWRSQETKSLIEIIRDSEEDLTGELGYMIVSAQLESSVESTATIMNQVLKDHIVVPILNWLVENPDKQISSEWWHQVLKYPEAVCQWLGNTDNIPSWLVARITTTFDPRTQYVFECPLSSWTRFSEAAHSELYDEELTSFMAFLLVIGLQTKEKDGAKIVSSTFPLVYTAIINRTLRQNSWDSLSWNLQKGFMWDRSKQLRVGIVEHFANHDWSVDQFLNLVPNAIFLRDVLGMWGWGNKETVFLSRVLHRGLELTYNLPNDQRKVLKEYQKWFSEK